MTWLMQKYSARGGGASIVPHALAALLAALLAYVVWRGYQNPDLLLELSALRLC